MKTLLMLAALGVVGYMLLHKPGASKTTTTGSNGISLTVIPLPQGSVRMFTISGNTIYRDSSGNYYAMQGSGPWVVQLTKANAENLLAQYLSGG